MRITLALDHSDEVSGTWIFEDGTKAFWTEGRSSAVIAILPDGRGLEIPAHAMDDHRDEAPAFIDALIEATENGPDAIAHRMMTPAEEIEHDMARN